MLDFGIKILGAIKALFGLKESLAKADIEHRGRMADLFEKVAVCLEQTAAQIRAGTYPGGRCQEMLSYAVDVPAMTKATIGEARAQEIGTALKESYQVERLFGDRETAAGEEQLQKLDEAAGTIRALGNILRV
jgi:hypothetical protein